MHHTTVNDPTRWRERIASGLPCVIWTIVAAGASLTLVSLLGTTPLLRGPTVEAETFIVKDKDGTIRAALGLTDATGEPGLVLYDHDGNANVLVHLGTDGTPGMWFYEKDRVRAALTARDSEAQLEFYDRNNRVRLELGLLQDDTVRVRLHDQQGQLRAALGDLELNPRLKNLKKKRSTASVVLFDQRENVIWRAP